MIMCGAVIEHCLHIILLLVYTNKLRVSFRSDYYIFFFYDLNIFIFLSGSCVIGLGLGFYPSPITCLGYPYIIP